jgi:hypothetical protein
MILGVPPETLLKQDDKAARKWLDRYPYFQLEPGFQFSYRMSNYQIDPMNQIIRGIFGEEYAQKDKLKYDPNCVVQRMREMLVEMDKDLPGTYHKDAWIEHVFIKTGFFFHYSQIEAFTHAYIDLIRRAEELFFRAWDEELSQDEVQEYNFLVSVLGITDSAQSAQKYLYYDRLKEVVDVYKQEDYRDFLSYVRLKKELVPQLWECAEFVENQKLVQEFLDVYPIAKNSMRQFAMKVPNYECVFTWSDAGEYQDDDSMSGMGQKLRDLPMLRKNGGRELTRVYVPKTAAELNGDKVYADELRKLSGPVKLGGLGIRSYDAVDLTWSQQIKRMEARISASHTRSWEERWYEL